MRMTILAIAAAATTMSLAPAAAQTVNHRQHRQEQRINRGVRNGHLTRAEAQRLRYLETRLRRTEARMRWRSGGHLTARERRRLLAMERRDRAEIYRLKHNHRRR